MPDPETTPTDVAKPERHADTRARLATLERELAEERRAADALRSALADREGALELMRVEASERDRALAQLRAELGRRDTAPARPVTRGAIVTMRARHRLHFSVAGEAVSVEAGREFTASISDLEDERLTQGADFDVLG